MRQFLLCLSFVFSAPLFVPLHVAAQTVTYCEYTDSTSASAAVDTMEAYVGAYHEFGENLSTWPHEFDLYADNDFKAFRQVFRLYLTDHVSGRFSTPQWESILYAIMNNDTTAARDDVFSYVWDYFTREEADSNLAYAGVRFRYAGITPKYTNINIYLYDTADIPQLYSTAYGNTVWVNASSNESLTYILGVVGHELQHLCFGANGTIQAGQWVRPRGYRGINETLSTLAEYFLDMWRPIAPYNIAYDSSFMDSEPCDIPQTGTSPSQPKYNIYKPWMIYLYEQGREGVYDPTDDLLYRWIRNNAQIDHRLWLDTLADLLWSDSSYDWLEGTNATDRLNRLYANFLAAKFCNAPDFSSYGEFGIGPAPFNTVTSLGFFTDNDNCGPPIPSGKYPESPVDCPAYENPANNWCWTVRVLLPTYELNADNEGTTTTQAHHFYATDTSVDSIDVYNYGTDYVVLRAGSYFEDGQEHELRLRVRGRPIASGASNGIKPVGWVMGYSADDDTLQVHPEYLLFVEPLSFTPATSTADSAFAQTVVVTDFGRSVKAVVLAIGSAGLRPDLNDYPTNGFTYAYDYGVLTAGATSRTWQGNVYALGDVSVPDNGALVVEAGTNVRIFNSDLATVGDDINRVEINIDGELVVNGATGSPVTIQPWTQTTSEDWAGIYFSEDSDGGTFNHCTIGYAEIVIDSYAPISIDHSTIRGASDALISMIGSTLAIDNSEISLSNGDGIVLNESDATIDSVEVKDCYGYGIRSAGSSALNISCADVHDNDIGVYVEDNSTNGTLISKSRFTDNDVGVSYYYSTWPKIDDCVVTGNTTGIRLDHFSSPMIVHCMDSATYDGDISGNGAGLYCTDGSSPDVGHCDIHDNNTGVGAFDGSSPDLDDYGANKFRTNSSYHVANLDAAIYISAMGNYWQANTGTPNYYPKATKILGNVDYQNALSGSPNPTSPWPGGDPSATPKTYATALGRAHPNPFNPRVQVPFSLRDPTVVRIRIYDAAGRVVRTLVNERRERGEHIVVWDGSSDSGTPAASAVYFVRMVAGSYTKSQKIVLLK